MRYTVELSQDEAGAIEEILAGNPGFIAERWGDPQATYVTLSLNEAAVGHLQRLPEESDGHVSDGALYMDGLSNPLTPIHSA